MIDVRRSDPFGYEGKRVVVTGGGGSGIGAAVVEGLSELGAQVHVLDLKGPSVVVASHDAVDLRDPSAVARAVARIGEPVHAVFNCAGISGPPSFTDVDTMLVNFLAARHVAMVSVPLMTEGGAICNTASAAGSQWQARFEQWRDLMDTPTYAEGHAWIEGHPEAIAGGYGPSKEALIVFTKLAAADLVGEDIRVNSVSPGSTDTPMMSAMDDVPGSDYYPNLFAQGMGRWARPSEQAWPMIFLNSPLASYITAENIVADGGTLAMVSVGRVELDFQPQRLVEVRNQG